MTITKDILMQDLQIKGRTLAFGIFTIVGFLIPFAPFTVNNEINKYSIGYFIMLAIVFGVPFGYVIGLRNIINSYRAKKCIENLDITIMVDKITELYVSNNEDTNGNSDSYSKLELKNYSKKYDKYVSVTFKTFRKLKKGDQCILVFVPFVKKPFFVYPGNKYSLSDELKEKVIQF